MRRQIRCRKGQVHQGCANDARQSDEEFVVFIGIDEGFIALFVEQLDAQVLTAGLSQTKTDTRANTLGYRRGKNAAGVGSVPFNCWRYRVAAATLTSTGIRVPGSYERRVVYSRP